MPMLEGTQVLLRELRAAKEKVSVDRDACALYAQMFAGTETGDRALATRARCERVLAELEATIAELAT